MLVLAADAAKCGAMDQQLARAADLARSLRALLAASSGRLQLRAEP